MAKKRKKAPRKKELTLTALNVELQHLKSELATLKESAGESHEVATSVDGPRRSEVAVDAQIIPMSGEYSRSGKKTIRLQRPLIEVDLLLRGQVGTSTTFKLTINGRTQTKSFVTTSEKQHEAFDFNFSDFGL